MRVAGRPASFSLSFFVLHSPPSVIVDQRLVAQRCASLLFIADSKYIFIDDSYRKCSVRVQSSVGRYDSFAFSIFKSRARIPLLDDNFASLAGRPMRSASASVGCDLKKSERSDRVADVRPAVGTMTDTRVPRFMTGASRETIHHDGNATETNRRCCCSVNLFFTDLSKWGLRERRIFQPVRARVTGYFFLTTVPYMSL